MNVIRHKTIRPDLDTNLASVLADQADVPAIVLFFEKRLLPPYASLGDVVRIVGDDKSWKFRHWIFSMARNAEIANLPSKHYRHTLS